MLTNFLFSFFSMNFFTSKIRGFDQVINEIGHCILPVIDIISDVLRFLLFQQFRIG